MSALLKGLLESGAPWGLLCATLTIAIATLWRRYTVLSDKLYDLAIQQTKGYTEVHGTLERVKEDLEEIRRRAAP